MREDELTSTLHESAMPKETKMKSKDFLGENLAERERAEMIARDIIIEEQYITMALEHGIDAVARHARNRYTEVEAEEIIDQVKFDVRQRQKVGEGESYYDKSQDYSTVGARTRSGKKHYSDMSPEEQAKDDAIQQHKSEWAERKRQNKMYEDEPKMKPTPSQHVFGVFATGGSIGSGHRSEPIKTFPTRPEAMQYAKQRRKGLSPGERQYYKMNYVVKPWEDKDGIGESIVDEGEPVSSPNIDSVESLKEHHPELYTFFKATGDWMTFDNYGKVESYHTSGQKFIVVTLQPTAGIENSMAVMKDNGVQFTQDEHGLNGKFGDIYWTMYTGGARGNRSETFRFSMPHKGPEPVATYHDRTMEEAISNSDVEEKVEIELGNIITDTIGYFPNDNYGLVNYINKKMNSLSEQQYNGLIQEPILQNEVLNGGIAIETLKSRLTPAIVPSWKR